MSENPLGFKPRQIAYISYLLRRGVGIGSADDSAAAHSGVKLYMHAQGVSHSKYYFTVRPCMMQRLYGLRSVKLQYMSGKLGRRVAQYQYRQSYACFAQYGSLIYVCNAEIVRT